MKTKLHNPATIGAADITELASQCRERALAARASATELTPEQTAAVGGGASSLGGLVPHRDPFPHGILEWKHAGDMFQTPVNRGLITDVAIPQGY